MEAPQMRGVEEPLLPEPRAVEGGATQSEGAIETQEARYPRLHKTAGLRSLDVWVEISRVGEAWCSRKSQARDEDVARQACRGRQRATQLHKAGREGHHNRPRTRRSARRTGGDPRYRGA